MLTGAKAGTYTVSPTQAACPPGSYGAIALSIHDIICIPTDGKVYDTGIHADVPKGLGIKIPFT